jgi:Sodium/calcium exchanger protein.
MIIGGIIGSNIFNILSVLAFSALSKALLIDARFAGFDLYAVLGVTIFFSVILLLIGRMARSVGFIMLVCYVAFVSAQHLLT